MFDVKWERQLHQAGSPSALAVAPGHIVVHERSTRLVSLDPVTGSVRWDVPLGTWPRAVVIAGQRCLALPQQPEELVCLDLDTGRREWTAGLRGYVGNLVVAGDTVLVGGWRGYTPLSALDIETGQLMAATECRVRTVRPASAGEGFLTGEPGGTTVRLMDRTGFGELFAWTLPQPLVDDDNRAVFTPVGPDRFLARCGNRGVVEIKLSAGAVDEFVRTEHDLAPTAPEQAGGLVWLTEHRGYTVTNSEDGRVVWRVDLAQLPAGRVLAVGAGFVLAGGEGALFRLDSRGRVRHRVQVTRRIRALRPVAPSGLLLMTKGTLLVADAGEQRTQEQITFDPMHGSSHRTAPA